MEISFTSRDFDAYFDELKTKAHEQFPEWTDFNKANVGVLFIEQLSSVGDQMSYYHNKQVNEMFLPTVKRRINAAKVLKRMDYALGGREPASVDLAFSFEGGGTHTQTVTIPVGKQITTEDGAYSFETIAPLVVPVGSTGGLVTAKNWFSQSDNLSFDGSSLQVKELLVDKHIQIDILYIEGLPWLEKEDLLDSLTTDRHFWTEINDELVAVLHFGDGVTGLKPTGNGIVSYKTGGGGAANAIQPGTIKTIIGDITDALGNTVQMICANAVSPSGGEDEESVDEARKKAPSAAREQKVTVSRMDYEDNAELVVGVSRALAYGKKEDVTIPLATMHVFIVPEGGGVPSTGLKTAVETFLTTVKPVMMCSFVYAMDPTYHGILITGTVAKRAGFTPAAVKTAVDAALVKYFTYNNLDEQNQYTVDWGFYKPMMFQSEIIGVILGAKISGALCVQSVTLTSPTVDTAILQKEMPNLLTLSGLLVP